MLINRKRKHIFNSWIDNIFKVKTLDLSSNKEPGFIIIPIIVAIVFILIFCFVLLTVVVKNNGGDGTGVAKQKDESNNLPSKTQDSSNNPDKAPSSNLPDKYDENQDLGSGYLKCVELNGVNFPRTPALDRRVRQIWLETKQDIDAQGIPPLRFSWGFRTNCQQINVDSGGNTKAEPGTSPHEAGRALDVRDMTRRNDAGQIRAIFVKHGWHWAGIKDPPHFDIKGYTVGEPSHADWIRKAQADFERGGPREGCRGTTCGQ